MWYGILIGLLLMSNWLWFVFFMSYRKEVGRQWRKAGYDKYKKELENAKAPTQDR